MSSVSFRQAAKDDLPAIVALLADDELGAAREDARLPLDPHYGAAFDALAADPNQMLLVAEDQEGIAGCLQLTFIPGLSRKGAWRGQIESVRVARSRRGSGLGRAMLLHAIEQCGRRGCAIVQLTTDKTREDAHRFYAGLGFAATHEGMKLELQATPDRRGAVDN